MALPLLAPLLALATASPTWADSLLATSSLPRAEFAQPGGVTGAVADFSRRLLMSDGGWRMQVLELLLLMLFWAAAFAKIRARVLLWEDRPWFERAVKLNQESLRKSFGIEVDLPEAKRIYATTISYATQHLTSGLLCLPAVFGALPLEVGSALTRHAAMSEAAWELMDVCEKVHQRFIKPGGARGREEVPDSMFFFTVIHHMMAMTLVMPVNCFYSDAWSYAVLVFDLQFAAGVSLIIYCYVFSLDLERPRELLQMKVMTICQFLIVVLSRGVVFPVAACDLLRLFARDQAAVLVALSVPAVLGMSLISLIFAYDSWCRMRKYLSLGATEREEQDQKLPLHGDKRAPAAHGRRGQAPRLAARRGPRALDFAAHYTGVTTLKGGQPSELDNKAVQAAGAGGPSPRTSSVTTCTNGFSSSGGTSDNDEDYLVIAHGENGEIEEESGTNFASV